MNRVKKVVDNLNVGERIHPDDVMQDLLEVLEEGASPTIGGIYTFIYFAKTPALRYDQHPLSVWKRYSNGVSRLLVSTGVK